MKFSFRSVYSVWTLNKSKSSRMLGVSSRNSLTARSTSFDCVTYLPTMSTSAPFYSASFAVSGTMPPATAVSNFLLLNALRIICMRSSPLLLPVSWSMPRWSMTMSGQFLSDLSFPGHLQR
jgi:hypothetical protein